MFRPNMQRRSRRQYIPAGLYCVTAIMVYETFGGDSGYFDEIKNSRQFTVTMVRTKTILVMLVDIAAQLRNGNQQDI